MDGKENIERQRGGKKERTVFNRDVFIFIFFLLLSFMFWYLNSLSKETEGEVSYPVRYVNTQKDRDLIDDLPPKLALSLKGPGYSILKLKLSGNSAPLLLDLSKLNLVRIPNSKMSAYYVVTNSLVNSFEQQLRAEFEITAVKPDTLFFSFDRIITKKVPVIPAVTATTERQYLVRGPVTSSPEYVEITGPKQVVDTVTGVRTKHFRYLMLNKSSKRTLPLITSEYYTIDTKRVEVTVTVEQFTEAEAEVKVKLVNIPDSLDIKIFPDVVTVKYLIGISDYKSVENIPLEAVIDLSEHDLIRINNLPVVLQNIPGNVSSLRFTPQKVDFVIEKKRE